MEKISFFSVGFFFAVFFLPGFQVCFRLSAWWTLQPAESFFPSVFPALWPVLLPVSSFCCVRLLLASGWPLPGLFPVFSFFRDQGKDLISVLILPLRVPCFRPHIFQSSLAAGQNLPVIHRAGASYLRYFKSDLLLVKYYMVFR